MVFETGFEIGFDTGFETGFDWFWIGQGSLGDKYLLLLLLDASNTKYTLCMTMPQAAGKKCFKSDLHPFQPKLI